MPRITFVAIRADRLAAGVVVTFVILAVASFIAFWQLGRNATPIPKTVYLPTLPATASPTPALPTASVGALAPDFTLPTVSGTRVTLSSFRGKPVLLYFWASWCSFCRDDMPALQQLESDYRDVGLTVLTINLLEKAELVKAFATQHKINLPLLLDANGAVSSSYLVRATPTYAFIDHEGVLRAQVVGRPRQAVLDRNLGLIAQAAQSASQGAGQSAGGQ